MPISIKDPDTDSKIRDLAALTGESITVAVRTAIEQRLRRESARRRAGVATRLLVVPFRQEGKTISIATLSPGDLLIEDEIGLLTNCMVSTFVTLEVRLYETMARLYGYAHLGPAVAVAPNKTAP